MITNITNLSRQLNTMSDMNDQTKTAQKESKESENVIPNELPISDESKHINEFDQKNNPSKMSSKKKFLSWKGQRPLIGALNLYKSVLQSAINNALKHLHNYPRHTYARVFLPLFKTISVVCHDQDNEKHIKKYSFHELHYGPERSMCRMNNMTPEQFKWYKFQCRNTFVWLNVNQCGKQSGGDGSGRGGTACSIFRDTQIALLQTGLYLIDASQVVYDETRKKLRYHINIYLQNVMPVEPVRRWHGYGHIPGLGAANRITYANHDYRNTFYNQNDRTN